MKDYNKTPARKRARKNWIMRHREKYDEYQKWYYINVTKPKRQAKSASLKNHQVS